MPEAMPEIPAGVCRERLHRLRERAAIHHWDRLVVYADREHSANLSYLTGFDPRFEEALLVLASEGDPAALIGNECYGLAGPGCGGELPGIGRVALTQHLHAAPRP